MQKIVLITGGLGYIGFHMTILLQFYGFKVIIIDNLSNSSIAVLKCIKKITGIMPLFKFLDLKNYFLVKKFFEFYSIDFIIHLAALKNILNSNMDPVKYYNNNITSLINILDSMITYKINNILFSSSASVYDYSSSFIREHDSLNPISSYAKSKLFCENILKDFSNSYYNNAISLRYFNVVGVYPYLKDHTNYYNFFINQENLFSRILNILLGCNNKLFITTNNSYYDFAVDNTPVRDYVDINDLCYLHVLLLDKLLFTKYIGYKVFNIGSGVGYSVLQIVSLFKKITGLEFCVEILKDTTTNINLFSVSSNIKINEYLNYINRKSIFYSIYNVWRYVKYLYRL